MDQAFSTSAGHSYGFWVFGMTCYHGVVLLVTAKIIGMSNNYSPMSIISLVMSYVLFILAWIWVSSIEIGVLENSFIFTWSNINIWLFTLVILGIAVIDYAVCKITNELFFKQYIPPATFIDLKALYGYDNGPTSATSMIKKNELLSSRFVRTYSSSLADKLAGGYY